MNTNIDYKQITKGKGLQIRIAEWGLARTRNLSSVNRTIRYLSWLTSHA